VLPSVFLAVALVLLTCVFDHQWLLQGFFQMLVSFWLLLLVIAAAVLLRAVFRGKIEVFPARGKYLRK
jgi:multisubunit Na+/H+ antiporter MnhB subunit